VEILHAQGGLDLPYAQPVARNQAWMKQDAIGWLTMRLGKSQKAARSLARDEIACRAAMV
jgi:hypothetical protein